MFLWGVRYAKENTNTNKSFYLEVMIDSEVMGDRDYTITLSTGEESDMRNALDRQEQPDRPNQIILPTGEVCRKKGSSARRASPFVGDGITRDTSSRSSSARAATRWHA